METKYLFAIILGIILMISLGSALYYPSGLGALESFTANINVEDPYNITAANVIVNHSIYIGSGTEWFSIYLSGSTGIINSTYPITFTNLSITESQISDLDHTIDDTNIDVLNVTINGSSVLQFEMNMSSRVCNEASAGSIYYNNATNKHYGCNVSTWNALY